MYSLQMSAFDYRLYKLGFTGKDFVFRLRKSDKLRKNKHFQAVYKSGKSFANRMLVLYVLPNQSDSRKIGFAAGKRLGNAVIRNRVKRLLRETYRLNQSKLPAGCDYILVGRQPAVGARCQDITASFLKLCDRISSGKQ